MIVYFANRNMEVIGSASTSLSDRFLIISDMKKENINSGSSIFDFTVLCDVQERLELESFLYPGNYVLRYAGDVNSNGYRISATNDVYTVIEMETDSKNKTVRVYCESAGMDLLNDIAFPYLSSTLMTVDQYILSALDGVNSSSRTNFKIGVNELPYKTMLLDFSTTSTVLERINSIADNFECEIDFTFDIVGLDVVNRYINIRKADNRERDIILRMHHNVSNIIVTRSITNMATAIYPTGSNNLSLASYTNPEKVDDGDIYLDNGWLKSRKALEKWYRVNSYGDDAGHIYRQFSYETSDINTLLTKAQEELKRICEPEITYEIDIEDLPESLVVGDRINIVDNDGKLFISARLLELTTSIVNNTKNAVLGDYKQKSSGISDKLSQLALEFSNRINTINNKIDNINIDVDNIGKDRMDQILI